MQQRHRVVIHIQDAGLRRYGLRDLMGVARSRDAGADVQEPSAPAVAGGYTVRSDSVGGRRAARVAG